MSAWLKRQNDRGLEPIGVLILVHKHMVEATSDISGEAGIADGVGPVQQEVVVIEHIVTLLGFNIRREQILQLNSPGRAPRKRRTQHFFDREFRIDATGIDREARPLCRKAAFAR